jgi:hypothetical protein
MDREGGTIWIADAHRDDRKRIVARSDEKLTAFVELESEIRATATEIQTQPRRRKPSGEAVNNRRNTF